MPERYSQRMYSAWKIADVFNSNNPIGSSVMLRIEQEDGSFEEKKVKIAGEATALPCGTVVVEIEGRFKQQKIKNITQIVNG